MKSTLTTPQTTPCSAPPCKPEACTTTTELLTPEQLARRLGISRRSLSNWTRDGLLPMIKIGRVCRFDFAKVSAALERYERGATGSISTQVTPL